MTPEQQRLLEEASAGFPTWTREQCLRWLAGLDLKNLEFFLFEVGIEIEPKARADLAREVALIRTEQQPRPRIKPTEIDPASLDLLATILSQMLQQLKGNRGPSNEPVFLVHGRDVDKMTLVARTLKTFGLDPIILREQPGAGKTIIEKLEAHVNVKGAVILLTADDVGALASDFENDARVKARVRQNVIYEMGLFDGKLGRNRVITLSSPSAKNGPIELPSDRSQVPSIPIDEPGAWRLRLGKELLALGYTLDWAKVT